MTGSGQTHIQKWRYGMNEKLNYEVGDIVKLKKTHPCGSSQWEILRVGADFRLKCMLHLSREFVKMILRDILYPCSCY